MMLTYAGTIYHIPLNATDLLIIHFFIDYAILAFGCCIAILWPIGIIKQTHNYYWILRG